MKAPCTDAEENNTPSEKNGECKQDFSRLRPSRVLQHATNSPTLWNEQGNDIQPRRRIGHPHCENLYHTEHPCDGQQASIDRSALFGGFDQRVGKDPESAGSKHRSQSDQDYIEGISPLNLEDKACCYD
jgi:hypothetical protein